MARGLVLAISTTLLIAFGCDGGNGRHSPPTVPPPPGDMDLSGTWEGQAVVVDVAGWERGCPWMSFEFPAGSSWQAQASFTQVAAHIEVRFARPALLYDLVFAGALDDGHLISTLDAEATENAFPCSPMSTFLAAREVAGTFEALGAGDDLFGTATIVYRRLDMATHELVGEEFAAPIRVTLHRAGGG